MLARDLGVFQHVVKAPLSRFAETLRSVKLAIDFAPTEGGMRVIGVVSSMPGEGKSTAAMNIAELVASSGSSVLVIDADLRSPTLTREITPNASAGLFEFLVNDVPINELIYSDEAKRLKFLPAAGKGGAAQKTDLIGSTKMAQLLTAARQTYNYVIIDLPPLAPVIDAKAVAGAVDGFVFVVEWGRNLDGDGFRRASQRAAGQPEDHRLLAQQGGRTQPAPLHLQRRKQRILPP